MERFNVSQRRESSKGTRLVAGPFLVRTEYA